MRLTISLTIAASLLSGRQPAADDLDRAADAGQRVLHLVGDDRGHLAEPGQRGLLAQLLLDPRRGRSGRAGCR